jgi:hypothetical protein
MKDQTINITSGTSDDARHLSRVALRVIERRSSEAADHVEGGDVMAAAGTLGILVDQLITLLAPYAGGRQEETVQADPEIIFQPPFGRWHDVAPGVEVRVLATDKAGTFRVRRQYAGGMPTPYPHVLIVLSNGSTLRTTQNTTADIGGLINAGEAKIYTVADLDGVTHNLRVASILDFYEVAGA